MTRSRKVRRQILAAPLLILAPCGLFALQSHRNAAEAHVHALTSASAGDENGSLFWRGMEAEERGEYRDSIEWGFGFLTGVLLIGGLTAWATRKEKTGIFDQASFDERGTHV